MPKELEFIGGKFPKPVKEALKERADIAGLSMNEYLERLFVKMLDDEGDGQFSETEFKQLMQKEVDAKIQAAIQKMPEASSFPKPIKDALKARAEASGLSVDEYLLRIVLQSFDKDADAQFSKEEYEALPTLDEKIQIAVEKAIAPILPKESEVLKQTVRQQLSSITAGELNCAIVDSYNETQDVKGVAKEPEIVIFFERLADDLRERAICKRSFF
ncbi:MAG: hypothetical protein IPJ74_09380 [Saprospiraceae bacterium]|nr:hypothetical protein [Saprospiraceae bacterium]